jgi:hypothetical protein
MVPRERGDEQENLIIAARSVLSVNFVNRSRSERIPRSLLQGASRLRMKSGDTVSIGIELYPR